MADTIKTISDVYNNTEVLKTTVNTVLQKVINEETNLKNLQDQIKRLESPPMMA